MAVAQPPGTILEIPKAAPAMAARSLHPPPKTAAAPNLGLLGSPGIGYRQKEVEELIEERVADAASSYQTGGDAMANAVLAQSHASPHGTGGPNSQCPWRSNDRADWCWWCGHKRSLRSSEVAGGTGAASWNFLQRVRTAPVPGHDGLRLMLGSWRLPWIPLPSYSSQSETGFTAYVWWSDGTGQPALPPRGCAREHLHEPTLVGNPSERDQRWITCSLAFPKELEVIQNKRAELTSGKWTSETSSDQPPAGATKKTQRRLRTRNGWSL